MTQVEVELHDDAVSILNKLKNINDTGIELVVPDGAVILENMVNLKLLKTWVEESGKTLHFLTNALEILYTIVNIPPNKTKNNTGK